MSTLTGNSRRITPPGIDFRRCSPGIEVRFRICDSACSPASPGAGGEGGRANPHPRNSPHLASSRAPGVLLEFHAGRPNGGPGFFAAVFMRAGPARESNVPQPFHRGGQDVEFKPLAAVFAGTGSLAYSGFRDWFDGGGAMRRRIFGRRTGMEGGAWAMKSPAAAVKTPGFEFPENSINIDKYR